MEGGRERQALADDCGCPAGLAPQGRAATQHSLGARLRARGQQQGPRGACHGLWELSAEERQKEETTSRCEVTQGAVGRRYRTPNGNKAQLSWEEVRRRRAAATGTDGPESSTGKDVRSTGEEGPEFQGQLK